MTQPLNLVVNHTGFFLNDLPFFPLITEEGTEAALVYLPALLNSDLNWDKERAIAKKLVAQGKLLFWQIDLGLERDELILNDTAIYFSFTIALEEFSKTLFNEFKHHTLGVSIYRGELDIAKRMVWDEKLHHQYLQSISEHTSNGFSPLYQAQVFAVSLFAEYLHRLGSHLHDEINVFCLFDVTAVTSPAKIAQLLSKERFAHLHLALKGSPLPFSPFCWDEKGIGAVDFSTVDIGLSFPLLDLCNQSILELHDELFEELQMLNISFRLIAEPHLTEQWNGIETIIVHSSSLSPHGKRQLQGFCAAGGMVVSIGEKIGFAEEISWDEFKENRSRGIRTPGLLVPNQSR